jgi:hypothetical protein
MRSMDQRLRKRSTARCNRNRIADGMALDGVVTSRVVAAERHLGDVAGDEDLAEAHRTLVIREDDARFLGEGDRFTVGDRGASRAGPVTTTLWRAAPPVADGFPVGRPERDARRVVRGGRVAWDGRQKQDEAPEGLQERATPGTDARKT